VVQRIPVKILFDQPLNGESGLPLGPGESVVPSVEISSPEYSPLALGIAFVVLGVGVILIVRRGLGRRPIPAKAPSSN